MNVKDDPCTPPKILLQRNNSII